MKPLPREDRDTIISGSLGRPAQGTESSAHQGTKRLTPSRGDRAAGRCSADTHRAVPNVSAPWSTREEVRDTSSPHTTGRGAPELQLFQSCLHVVTSGRTQARWDHRHEGTDAALLGQGQRPPAPGSVWLSLCFSCQHTLPPPVRSTLDTKAAAVSQESQENWGTGLLQHFNKMLILKEKESAGRRQKCRTEIIQLI